MTTITEIVILALAIIATGAAVLVQGRRITLQNKRIAGLEKRTLPFDCSGMWVKTDGTDTVLGIASEDINAGDLVIYDRESGSLKKRRS